MSGQPQSFFQLDEDPGLSNVLKAKVLAVLNKLKIPFLLLLILVSWITLGVKVSKLSSEVNSYTRKFTKVEVEVDSHKRKLTYLDYEVAQVDANQKKSAYDSFHSRAASAEDCEELRNHGFSTSGYFLIGK